MHRPLPGPSIPFSLPWVFALALMLFIHGLPGAAPDRHAVRLFHELILPEFNLRKSTFENGVAEIKKAWAKQHPDVPFPVVLAEPVKHTPPMFISMDLRNVSALDALTYLADYYGLVVRHALSEVMLQPKSQEDEGMWRASLIHVPPRAATYLGLVAGQRADEKVNQELRRKLEGLGLKFEGDFEVRWLGGTSEVYFRNTPAQEARLETLIMLLNAGYTVEKDPNAGRERKSGDK
jgi:hypothetical protein